MSGNLRKIPGQLYHIIALGKSEVFGTNVHEHISRSHALERGRRWREISKNVMLLLTPLLQQSTVNIQEYEITLPKIYLTLLLDIL